MIKRNKVKAGDVLRWLGEDECIILILEQASNHGSFSVWRAYNMSEGKYESVEINSANAVLWTRVA